MFPFTQDVLDDVYYGLKVTEAPTTPQIGRTEFTIGTAYNLINDVSDEAWKSWWKIQVSIFAAMAVLVTVWYAIGGTCNVIDLYKTLKSKEIDIHDDGTVQHDEQ